MNDSPIFLNEQLFWPILFVVSVLFVVFIWKEWSHPGRQRFITRVAMVFLTLISVGLIALKPLKPTRVSTAAAVVITENYQQQKLDSLLENYKDLKQIHYKPSVSFVEDLDAFNPLFIIGKGPEPFDHWQFKELPVTYLGGAKPEGIVRLKFNSENFVGDRLELSGQYNAPKTGNRLVLQGPVGKGIDSVLLPGTSQTHFTLSTPLKAIGKFVYNIVEKDTAGHIVNKEPLAIKVKENTVLDILFLNAYPTFETRNLKNYLGNMGHKVLVRSQITKDRYKYEYINKTKSSGFVFNNKELSNYDLLIIDYPTYGSLSGSQQKAVERAVAEEGLGLIVQPAERLFQRTDRLFSNLFLNDNATEILVKEQPGFNLTKFPYQFKASALLSSTFEIQNKPIAAYRNFGKGRVGTILLRDTYRLRLKGKALYYQTIWASLISGISKKKLVDTAWKLSAQPVYRDRPLHFTLWNAHDSPGVITAEDWAIPLVQDLDIKERWSGRVHPSTLGWNQLLLTGDSTAVKDFYVVDSSRWKSLNGYNTILANKRHFRSLEQTARQRTVNSIIPPVWFYLLFLVGMTYLWLEPKFGR